MEAAPYDSSLVPIFHDEGEGECQDITEEKNHPNYPHSRSTELPAN